MLRSLSRLSPLGARGAVSAFKPRISCPLGQLAKRKAGSMADGEFKLGPCGVDHFVIGLPHEMLVEEGIAWFEGLTGVRPNMGGKHKGYGTHNAIVGLGDNCYLELLAVDPEQRPPGGEIAAAVSWMGMQENRPAPRMLTWCMHPVAGGMGLESLVEGANAAGYNPGEIKPFSRATSTGEELRWRSVFNHYSSPLLGGGLVPFLIEWLDGAAPPPKTAPKGISLVDIRAGHPKPEEVVPILTALGLRDWPIAVAPEPFLEIEIETPKGRIVLR